MRQHHPWQHIYVIRRGNDEPDYQPADNVEFSCGLCLFKRFVQHTKSGRWHWETIRAIPASQVQEIEARDAVPLSAQLRDRLAYGVQSEEVPAHA